jgi:hypothetical protein
MTSMKIEFVYCDIPFQRVYSKKVIMLTVCEYIEKYNFPMNPDYMKIFWEIIKNRPWIPLNRDVIKHWFCKNDKNRNCVQKFYERILFKYEENVDYKKISHDEPLMKIYENFYTTGSKTNIDKRAAYYAVTGECFKLICLTRNPEI